MKNLEEIVSKLNNIHAHILCHINYLNKEMFGLEKEFKELIDELEKIISNHNWEKFSTEYGLDYNVNFVENLVEIIKGNKSALTSISFFKDLSNHPVDIMQYDFDSIKIDGVEIDKRDIRDIIINLELH